MIPLKPNHIKALRMETGVHNTSDIYPCVQCGYCCTQSACSAGKWNPKKKRCMFLNQDGTCDKYDEIKSHEDEQIRSGNFCLPMMGSGCSSPLCNTLRNAKMREKGMDVEAEREQLEQRFGIELEFSEDFKESWDQLFNGESS